MNFMCTLHVASRVSTLTTSGAHSVCGGDQFPFTTVYLQCSLSGGVRVFGARLFPRAVRDAVILFVDSDVYFVGVDNLLAYKYKGLLFARTFIHRTCCIVSCYYLI